MQCISGHLGRQKPTPLGNGGEEIPAQQNPVEVEEKRPDGPQLEALPVVSPGIDGITSERVRQFLDAP